MTTFKEYVLLTESFSSDEECVTSASDDEFSSASKNVFSHFDLDEDEACKAYLTGPSIRNIRDRIDDDKQLYDKREFLREHFVCRDRNFTLYLDYKEGMKDRTTLEREMLDMTREHPRNVVSLCNLAHLKLTVLHQVDAESCLTKLSGVTPLERMLADAEIAYAYLKLGPRCYLKCLELSEDIVDFAISETAALGQDGDLLNELKVEYSYVAALAIERLFDQNEHADVLKNQLGRWAIEPLMEKSARFLKNLVFSSSRNYAAIGYLLLRSTFQRFEKLSCIPFEERSVSLPTLVLLWPGLTGVHTKECLAQCLAKAVKAVEEVGRENADYRVLEMLGDENRKYGANQDLDKAEMYLKAAAEKSKRPAIYHHLGLVYRQKWQKKSQYQADKRNPDQNFRDPGNPLLKKAIEHFEKAVSYSHNTSVLFQVDLARVKYSYCEQPLSEESRNEIMDILNGCVMHNMRLGVTTSGIQAYLFHELGLMYDRLLHDKGKCRSYCRLSVEQAIKANKNSPALIDLIKMHDKLEMQQNPDLFENLGIMFKLFDLVESVRWNLDRAQKTKRGKKGKKANAPFLERLASYLIDQEEFHYARQCMILLKANEFRYLEKPGKRKRYMDASLQVARQFPQDTAATIYQELIRELKPVTGASSVVVISSKDESDDPRTKLLVRMFREGLGFNDDTCILLKEKAGDFLGDSGEPISSCTEYFVKKAWCVVIHLTDVVLGEGMSVLHHDIDSSILNIQNRKGRVVVVNDVNRQGRDWETRIGSQLPRCKPWTKWETLFRSPTSVARGDNLQENVATGALGETKRGKEGGQGRTPRTDMARSGTPGTCTTGETERARSPTHPAFKPMVQLRTAARSGKRSGMGQSRRETNTAGQDVSCCEPRYEETQGKGASIDKESAEPAAGELMWDFTGLEALVRAMLTPSSTR